MRTFWVVLKNNYFRTVPRLGEVLAMISLTLAALFLGVYFTSAQEIVGHVALVAPDPAFRAAETSKHLRITVVNERPPLSDLVKQKYGAIAEFDSEGNLLLETLYNEEKAEMFRHALLNPALNLGGKADARSVGENIVGFSTLFMLMFSVWNLTGFAFDKEQGHLRRIAAAPASFFGYLAAHSAYCFSAALPLFVLLIILKAVGWDLGFTLSQFALLLFLQAFLGLSVGLVLNTLMDKPDNANMLGSAVFVLTTVMAGGFYSFARQDTLFDKLTRLLPQKGIMEVASLFAQGLPWINTGFFLYVLVFCLSLFTFSLIKLRTMYVKRV